MVEGQGEVKADGASARQRTLYEIGSLGDAHFGEEDGGVAEGGVFAE
jgi:hypothetical protein